MKVIAHLVLSAQLVLQPVAGTPAVALPDGVATGVSLVSSDLLGTDSWLCAYLRFLQC